VGEAPQVFVAVGNTLLRRAMDINDKTSHECEVCGSSLIVRWTDTHGVGVCRVCGLPYRVYHYDSEGHRFNAPPECKIESWFLPFCRKYWAEKRMRILPGVFDLGFLSGRTSTYSGATREEINAWRDWEDARVDDILAAKNQR
jgi:ribosomal protein L37AE/L43A